MLLMTVISLKCTYSTPHIYSKLIILYFLNSQGSLNRVFCFFSDLITQHLTSPGRKINIKEIFGNRTQGKVTITDLSMSVLKRLDRWTEILTDPPFVISQYVHIDPPKHLSIRTFQSF